MRTTPILAVTLVVAFSSCNPSQPEQSPEASLSRNLQDTRNELGAALRRQDKRLELIATMLGDLVKGSKVHPVDAVRGQEEMVGRDARISIQFEKGIVFGDGRADLEDDHRELLRRAAEVLKSKFAERWVYVEGHSAPGEKPAVVSNTRQLAIARASAVVDFLVDGCGTAPDSLVIVAYDTSDPLGPDAAQNRRVELVIGEKK